MVVRVNVAPALLDWAIARAKITPDDSPRIFSNYTKWRAQDTEPTLRQLEDFSKATYTPFGYFFLKNIPKTDLAIPDFRTIQNAEMEEPSLNLKAIVDICNDRLIWYRDYCLRNNFPKVSISNTAKLKDQPADKAVAASELLGFNSIQKSKLADLTETFKFLISRIEELGVLVMISGIVGSNTRRRLDPKEFRGFAISDDFAPLIFINGADSKSAQIFTLMHEFGHLMLGESGVSEYDHSSDPRNEHELWCNAFAAEFLAPSSEIRKFFSSSITLENIKIAARTLRVSSLVVLKQLYKTKKINWEEYSYFYAQEQNNFLEHANKNKSSGGDFYRTQANRLSKNFVIAVATEAREGKTSYRDAFQMLGTAKHETFNRLAELAGAK